ncbi:hypothetical protein V6N12_012759 [Hibiscus sabdariffa]|uniref:Uncharacterized protein n=1 Tax=Hibiscus sabdariffa TaxID=183260 RepID=A0ABR2EHN0_9ROSI
MHTHSRFSWSSAWKALTEKINGGYSRSDSRKREDFDSDDGRAIGMAGDGVERQRAPKFDHVWEFKDFAVEIRMRSGKENEEWRWPVLLSRRNG